MTNKTLFSSKTSKLPRADAINEAGGRAYLMAGGTAAVMMVPAG